MRVLQGRKKAALTVAHRVRMIAFHIPRDGEVDHEFGGDFYDWQHPERTAKRLLERLKHLGLEVELRPRAEETEAAVAKAVAVGAPGRILVRIWCHRGDIVSCFMMSFGGGRLTTSCSTDRGTGPGTLGALVEKFYPELRRMARRLMTGERKNHTLSGTAVVHETFIRLARGGPAVWEQPGHFFLTAAKIMRHVLTDHSRRRLAAKRTQREEIGLPENLTYSAEELVVVGDLVEQLEATDRRAAAVFSLRFYAGMTIEEAAAALGLSPAVAAQDWRWARAWLRAAVNRDGRQRPEEDESGTKRILQVRF